ncbi:serine hydroxymethyltransferase [Candidatus Gracilibacteria bacterium]|nr:serine hydroxymethyltransferase [Candidatus Gracilibacteria bacterium]NUJ98699.1 serine hydroxymethyltransferase [Candidatus Gracilibacteria bacterium]
MNFDNLKKTDPLCYDLVLKEMERQENTLELIPSECIASLSTIEALGTPLTNKYSEGYAGKRYYGGNEYIDEIEKLAISRAKELFKVPYVNVQPYSGSPANFAVYCATCEPGDTIAGQSLLDGGHLTHGWSASMTGKFFNSVQYHVKGDGYIDIENVRKVILENKPKLVWIGASAYPREFPFKEIAEIAHQVGAYVAADIAHISGLVVSGVHPSPNPYVHIITTTTHKTLRGPRGGMIMVTDLGLQKDPDLGKKIDKAVFPGLQGGPHNHQTLAIAVALGEALSPSFVEQNFQIVRNAKFLAEKLQEKGFRLISGGTDNHLILLDVGPGRGIFLQEALDKAGITLNKNTIPEEPVSAFFPSGIRLGTPIMTMRGMKEHEMKKVADFIYRVSEEIKEFSYLDTKEERLEQMKKFKEYIEKNDSLLKIKKEVAELCSNFPIYR